MKDAYTYIIVGAGLAGGSAVAGIREHDKDGSILLVGDEKHYPYNRPPLTKDLWWGSMQVEGIFVNDRSYYARNGVDVLLETRIVALDAVKKEIVDGRGIAYRFEKLLLATGGTPRTLPIPGGTLEEICYYRYLDDYQRLREQAQAGSSAVIVGGGFIGSELGASLCKDGVNVTMVYPDEYLLSKVLPQYMGDTLQQQFIMHGITVLNNDKPVSFEKSGTKFVTRTQNGKELESDMLIVGIGIALSSKLAEAAGLETHKGIVVNEYLQSTHPDIYAAGDNAVFPYLALDERMHVEHWDNAAHQGHCAGANMAGAGQRYEYMPDFFSDMFQFSYQAVGECSSSLRTIPDWQVENEKGVIYYLRGDRLVGVMACNIPGKIDQARELIRGKAMPADIHAAIK